LAVVGPMIYVLAMHPPKMSGTPTPSSSPAVNATPSPTLSPTATPNATATAQSMATTATAQAKNATATVVAGATATVHAQASATAGVIQTATASNAVYQDPLTDPNNQATQAEQWDQNKNCAFQSDGYHVTGNNFIGQIGLVGCHEAGTQYTNATFSTDVSIINGHSGGLFFYMKQKTFGAYAGYLFEVDSHGNYKISRSDNFSTGDNTVALQDWTASSALKTGTGVKNKLQVIARDGSLLFYINGAFVSQQQDSTFTTGYIGFVATAESGQQADVVYTNVAVFQQS
jgi:hypothetical protein